MQHGISVSRIRGGGCGGRSYPWSAFLFPCFGPVAASVACESAFARFDVTRRSGVVSQSIYSSMSALLPLVLDPASAGHYFVLRKQCSAALAG